MNVAILSSCSTGITSHQQQLSLVVLDSSCAICNCAGTMINKAELQLQSLSVHCREDNRLYLLALPLILLGLQWGAACYIICAAGVQLLPRLP